jgi:hypothetical protein
MGLIYTLQIGSKSSHWIGFQVLAGFGVGFAFQIPQIVAQSVSGLPEVSHFTAISLCKLTPTNSEKGYSLTNGSFPNDGRYILHLCGTVDFCE